MPLVNQAGPGRLARRAARQGGGPGAVPDACARTSARSSPAPSSPCSATCAPPGSPTASSSSRPRWTRAATRWPAWPPTRRSSGPTGTSGPARRQPSPRSGSRSACEYQIVPEEQPAKIDWYTGKPLTYDVDHTDGYILIDPAGRERFVDAVGAESEGRSSNAKLRSLLDDGGLHELQNPASARLDDGRCAGLHQLAARHQHPGIGLLMGGRLRRTALVVPAALAGLALLLSACGGAGSDVTTLSGPADHRQLVDAHAAAFSGRADPRHRRRQHALRLRPRHSDPQRLHSATVCVFQWPPLVTSGPVRVGKGVDRRTGGHAPPARRLDPALLRRPPALHVQRRRRARASSWARRSTRTAASGTC